MRGLFIDLANAFLAVCGFVLSLFLAFGVLCLLLRFYLALEGFVASKFAEDAGADWTDPDGGISSVNEVFRGGHR